MKELSPLGQAALAYAERCGWSVFPVIPYQKRPLIADYYTASSADPAQIAAWWTEYPQANIGLDCGKSGICAIDVDTRNGGDVTIRGLKLLTGGKQQWSTRRHRTPSDGEHYLFAAPPPGEDGLRSGSGRFGKGLGVDVKTQGGYVVLPPSCLPGYGTETYALVDDVPLLPLPKKLRFASTVTRDDAGRTELESTLHSGDRIPLGSQDNFLYSVASKLRRIGMEDVEIAAALREMYALRCEPPPAGTQGHTEEDFIRIARSATRHHVEETLLEDARIAATSAEAGEWDDDDQTVSVNARDFIFEEADEKTWIVEGMLQASSLNQFIGGPKAGKSTVARRLALDVAFGLPFLGRFQTRPSRVLYYSLQENRKHLRGWLGSAVKTLADQGVDVDSIPIDFVFRLGRRGTPAISGLLARCKRRNYGLVVVDMFGRFVGLRSLDDYAEVETLCDSLKNVADQTGACILWLHHERKTKDFGDIFSGTLGSQAIRGAVYTTMRMARERGKFYFATEQRDGDDLADTTIAYDKDTGVMRAAGNRLAATIAAEAQWHAKVEAVAAAHPTISAKQLHHEVGGQLSRVSEVLRGIRGLQGD